MRHGGQNAKGSAFERLVCRMLTKWVTGHPTPEIFWRSATSGAKATVDRKAGRKSNMGGDLVAVDPLGIPFIKKYSVECKNRAGYGKLENLIVGKGELLEWWKQCVDDAEAADRTPLLIYKALRTPIYLACYEGDSLNSSLLGFNCPVQNIVVGIYPLQWWLDNNKPPRVGGLRRVGT